MKSITIGERIVVHNIDYAVARVSNVTWVPEEVRWRLDVDWGGFGTSYVYDTDENKTWYRYTTAN